MKQAYRDVGSACTRVGQASQTAGTFLAGLCLFFGVTFAASIPASWRARDIDSEGWRLGGLPLTQWLGTFGVISGTPIAVAEEEFGARNKEKSRRGVGTSKFFRPTERRKFQNFASIAEANFNTRVLCHQRRICPGLLHEGHTS